MWNVDVISFSSRRGSVGTVTTSQANGDGENVSTSSHMSKFPRLPPIGKCITSSWFSVSIRHLCNLFWGRHLERVGIPGINKLVYVIMYTQIPTTIYHLNRRMKNLCCKCLNPPWKLKWWSQENPHPQQGPNIFIVDFPASHVSFHGGAVVTYHTNCLFQPFRKKYSST